MLRSERIGTDESRKGIGTQWLRIGTDKFGSKELVKVSVYYIWIGSCRREGTAKIQKVVPIVRSDVSLQIGRGIKTLSILIDRVRMDVDGSVRGGDC